VSWRKVRLSTQETFLASWVHGLSLDCHERTRTGMWGSTPRAKVRTSSGRSWKSMNRDLSIAIGNAGKELERLQCSKNYTSTHLPFMRWDGFIRTPPCGNFGANLYMAKAKSLLLQKVRTERSIGIGSGNAESLHKGQLRAACSWFVAACPRRLGSAQKVRPLDSSWRRGEVCQNP